MSLSKEANLSEAAFNITGWTREMSASVKDTVSVAEMIAFKKKPDFGDPKKTNAFILECNLKGIDCLKCKHAGCSHTQCDLHSYKSTTKQVSLFLCGSIAICSLVAMLLRFVTQCSRQSALDMAEAAAAAVRQDGGDGGDAAAEAHALDEQKRALYNQARQPLLRCHTGKIQKQAFPCAHCRACKSCIPHAIDGAEEEKGFCSGCVKPLVKTITPGISVVYVCQTKDCEYCGQVRVLCVCMWVNLCQNLHVYACDPVVGFIFPVLHRALWH